MEGENTQMLHVTREQYEEKGEEKFFKYLASKILNEMSKEELEKMFIFESLVPGTEKYAKTLDNMHLWEPEQQKLILNLKEKDLVLIKAIYNEIRN